MSSALEQFLTGEYPLTWHDEQALKRQAAQEKTAALEKKSAPLMEFLRTLPGRSWAGLRGVGTRALPVAGTAIAAGALMEGAAKVQESLVGAVQKSMSFRRMMKHDPGLSEIPSERLKNYFDTLYQYSPAVAKSPLVASSWVRQMSTSVLEGRPYVPPEAIRGLLDVQRGVADIQSRGMLGGALRSVPQLMAGGVVKGQQDAAAAAAKGSTGSTSPA